MDLPEVARRLDEVFIGAEHFAAAKAAGRGAIIALPHSGNWDLAGVWVVQHYGRFATVAERLKPESLYRRFVEYRESLGFEIIPLTGGAQPPFEVLADRLRGNGIVCLMSDRDLTSRGVEVEFFGEPPGCRPARPTGLETGAPLHPAHVHYDGDDCVVHIFDALDTVPVTSGSSRRRSRTCSPGPSPSTRGLAHVAAPVDGRSVAEKRARLHRGT
jgi:KDO2-lipid IV(A) lauroyltransferase